MAPRTQQQITATPRSPWGAGWRGAVRVALLLALGLSPPLPGGATAAPGSSPPAPLLPPTFQSIPVPRSVVASLAQDARGLIWVGTGNGLASWDGQRLRYLERPGRTAGERNLGWVRALAASPQGPLWIGSETEGLISYDPATGAVRTLGGPHPAGRAQPAVMALAVTPAGVWVGTLGGGLQHLPTPGAGEKLHTLTTPDARVLSLQPDPAGGLWVGHWSGLARVAPGARSAEPVLPTNAPVTALRSLPNGAVWLGLQDGRLGLWAPGRPEPIWTPAGDAGPITALEVDAQGRLWVGRSRGGIELRDAHGGALLERLRVGGPGSGHLAGDHIVALLRDRSGTLWVGGFGLGLQRQADNAGVQLLTAESTEDGAALDARSLQLWRTPQGPELLVATHPGPVLRLDLQWRPRGVLALAGRPRAGAQRPVQAMGVDAQARLWWVDGQTLGCVRPNGSACGQWSAPLGHINRLRPLRNGSVWLFGQDGVHVLQGEDDRRLQRALSHDGQPWVGEAFDGVEDREGALWVATAQGMWRSPVGNAGGTPRLERVAEAPQAGLGSPVAIGLLLDRSGRLWVDTSVGGLHRLEGLDAEGRARFDAVSERHGRAGRPFGANLHEDADGRIWSQAFVYDPRTDGLEELREADALALGTPWFFAHTELPDGRFVFGGSRGLLVVQPAQHGLNRQPPPLVARGLRVEGQAQALPARGQALKLPPLARGFALEFSALEYAAPNTVHYRYRLDGHDPEGAWTLADSSGREASYGQLPPGDYLLRVQAGNRPGRWDSPELRLPVQVPAAWWQSAWAKALALLAGLLAVRAWTARRTRQLRAREAALQALVDERTQALRDAALTDPLTGLRNRRFLMQRIEGDLRLSERRAQDSGDTPPGDDLIVFLLDLDHFKQLNDTLGHAAGDAALQQTADRLRGVFRDSDLLMRWGGEEFLVVARGSRREAAAELAERLRRALADLPMVLGGVMQLRTVTASIGYAVFPPDPQAPQAWGWEALLQLADAALYAAKKAGRNTWVGVRAAPGLTPADLPAGPATADELAALGFRMERPPLDPAATPLESLRATQSASR